MAHKHKSLDYAEAKRVLDGYSSPSFKPRKKRTRPSDRVKLANNTYLIRESARRLVLELHGHTIVTFTPHYLEFDTCGWPTVTTKERMNWTPVSIEADRGGWTLYTAGMRTCYRCDGSKTDPHRGGFTYAEELVTPEDGGTPYHPAIWTPAPCAECNENGQVPGYDWGSGGHPFFDGMRTDSKGTRLLSRQPRRPERREPVKTISGFSGGPLRPERGMRYHGYAVA